MDRYGADGLRSHQIRAYDHRGRRIFKSDKNVSTGVVHQWWFYYDQSDRLIGVRDIPNAASPTTYNIHVLFYLDDERVARMVLKYVNGSFNQEQRDLFHEDHLQTPMALERWPTSGASTVVWSADYKPWGYAQVAGGSTAVVDHRFPGQWYDTETESRTWVSGVNTLQRPGLAQNWMREYDAWGGAYATSDPLLVEPRTSGWTQPYSVQIAAGDYQTCALRLDGTVRCWGRTPLADRVQLHVGFLERVFAVAGASAIFAGALSAAAITPSGALLWGPNVVEGGLFSEPRPVAPLANASFVALGAGHALAQFRDGSVWCFGQTDVGQCGARAPERVSRRLVERAAEVAAGSGHSCVHRPDNLVQCWGDNTDGQLGGSLALSSAGRGVLLDVEAKASSLLRR